MWGLPEIILMNAEEARRKTSKAIDSKESIGPILRHINKRIERIVGRGKSSAAFDKDFGYDKPLTSRQKISVTAKLRQERYSVLVENDGGFTVSW